MSRGLTWRQFPLCLTLTPKYDPVTKTDRRVQLFIECSDKVIKHLPDEILANIAAGLPERAFTVTVELLEVGERPTGKNRKWQAS